MQVELQIKLQKINQKKKEDKKVTETGQTNRDKSGHSKTTKENSISN